MSRLSKIGMGLMGWSLATVLVLELDGARSIQASECLPPTPCPCAADGKCLPKRDTWGNYQTHWRPWPGEQVGLTPTQAEEQESNLRERLPNYQPPRPEQEELRGPAKGSKSQSGGASSTTTAAPQDAPAANEAKPAEKEIDLPGLPGLPGFDPQGYFPPENPQQLPPLEDGPPALPLGLSASLAVTPIQQNLQKQPTSGPTAVANQSRAVFIPAKVDNSIETGFVLPAAAESQPLSNIQLQNPAGRNIYKPTDEELHQAIYIESSDVTPEAN